MPIETDVLIIGSGIAGASAALRLARDGQRQVLLITRTAPPAESNTCYAQGGIVARSPGDSPDLLVRDVLAAGAGLSYPAAARLLAEEGPDLVQRLLVEEAGVERAVEMTAGSTFVVPAGAWHRAVKVEPHKLMAITYGAGTKHRPA